MSRDYVNVPWCEDNVYFSMDVAGSKGQTYHVTFDSGRGWQCPCLAFKYQKRECKHIEAAKAHRCTWGEGACINSPDSWTIPDDRKCPRCGKSATLVKICV